MAQNRVRQVRASASRSVSSLPCESVGIRAVWVCFVARRRLLVLHSTSLVDGFPLFGGTPDVESGLPRIFIFRNSFADLSLYLSTRPDVARQIIYFIERCAHCAAREELNKILLYAIELYCTREPN